MLSCLLLSHIGTYSKAKTVCLLTSLHNSLLHTMLAACINAKLTIAGYNLNWQ